MANTTPPPTSGQSLDEIVSDSDSAMSQGAFTMGAVGTVMAAHDSVIAQSLLSANFAQLIAGDFLLHMGDVISILGVGLLIWNTFKPKR
jgi:hypothetical protein